MSLNIQIQAKKAKFCKQISQKKEIFALGIRTEELSKAASGYTVSLYCNLNDELEEDDRDLLLDRKVTEIGLLLKSLTAREGGCD